MSAARESTLTSAVHDLATCLSLQQQPAAAAAAAVYDEDDGGSQFLPERLFLRTLQVCLFIFVSAPDLFYKANE